MMTQAPTHLPTTNRLLTTKPPTPYPSLSLLPPPPPPLLLSSLLFLPKRTSYLHFWVIILWILEMTGPSQAVVKTNKETRFYPMTRPVCNGVYGNIPGAVLEGGGSLGKAPPVCDVTFVSARDDAAWMLQFERDRIKDCSVFVSVIDSSVHPANRPSLLTLSCMDKNPGIIFINSTSITIRLQHRNATQYTFRIVITAITTDPYAPNCQGFPCDNGVCIPKSLRCDGTDNCFDGSDETKNGTSQCYDSIWPLQGENWGVLASVLGVGLVLGLMAACCRHIKRKRQSTIDDLYDLNEGPYVHKYAYRYAIIRPPKKPNKTKVVLGRDGSPCWHV